MRLYDALNNTVAVEEQYLLLKKMLEEQLALEPNARIKNWFTSWEKKRALSEADILG